MTKNDDVKKKEEPTFADFLESKRDQLAAVMPQSIDADRFLNLVLNECRANPKLLQCSQRSLIGALLNCAATGLYPGPFGHACLVPFRNKGTLEAQFIAEYKGLIYLMCQSGNVSKIMAAVVYENDLKKPGKFEYEYGDNQRLEHIPILVGERGKPLVTYSHVTMTDGSTSFVVMREDEIQKIKKISKAKLEPGKPWYDHEDEMRKKTVIRRHSKLIPLDPEIARKVAQDQTIKFISPEAIEEGKPINVIDEPDSAEWEPKTESKITKDIRKQKEPETKDKAQLPTHEAKDHVRGFALQSQTKKQVEDKLKQKENGE